MKKHAFKAAALAAALACGGSAYAGSISSPATDAAATVYAVEALTGATDVTSPVIVYTMGVPRTPAQDFTVIVTPSAGATFTAASCGAATPVMAGAGAATVSLKRSSVSECAWEVDVTTDSIVGDTLTMTGLVFDSHTLNTAGNSASITIALKDLGETAFIDNSGSLSRKVATSVQAINIYAATSDVATTADVNATGGPLTGFVAGGAAPADSASIAAANLTFDNNSVGANDASGAAAFDFSGTTGTASVTLTGSTSGLKANNFCLDLNGAILCEAGEVMTANATSATLSGIPSAAFPPAGSAAAHVVTFEADGTTQLGTGRNFALTGTITPEVNDAEALADTAGKNATAWVWTANASQLISPYMSTNNLYVTRFSMLNTGSSAVGYSVTCYAEGANVATNGANGTLKANGTTIVNASDACTFSDATTPRGAVMFTINAPINTVKGTYNIVDKVSGANGFVPLTRPYNGASTTE